MIAISSFNTVLLSNLYLYVSAYTEAVLIKERWVSHIKSSSVAFISPSPPLPSPPLPHRLAAMGWLT